MFTPFAFIQDVVIASPSIFDPDAQAFITAAGITDPTQQTSINTLVVGLKADNLWDNMSAIYPFVGGTSTSHKYNLKDPRDLNAAYALSFGGGWVHNSNGSIGNGVNTFAQTFFNNLGDGTMGIYNRGGNPIMGGRFEEWEGQDYPVYYLPWKFIAGFTTNIEGVFSNGSSAYGINSVIVQSPQTGLFTLSGNNTISRLYRNGSQIGSVAPSEIPSTLFTPIWLGGINDNSRYGSPTYGNSQLAFGFITTTVLTSTDNTNLYNLIQAFQTTLGRQV
jgi:hypothetical protein